MTDEEPHESAKFEAELYWNPESDSAELSLGPASGNAIDVPEKNLRLWFSAFDGRLYEVEFLRDARALMPRAADTELRHQASNRDAPEDPICCSMMRPYATGKACSESGHTWENCGDYVVARIDDNYGLPVRDGADGSASSYIQISHCPWCAAKLENGG